MSRCGQQQQQRDSQVHVAVFSLFFLSSFVFPVRASLKRFVILTDDVSRHPECNGTVCSVEMRFEEH
jgi:hypothetical protein